MNSKQKNLQLLFLCSLSLLCFLAVYSVVLSQASAESQEYTSTGKTPLNFGERTVYAISSNLNPYLYFTASENDTYQVSFHRDNKEETLLINTGSWASPNADGSVTILQWIPEYIQTMGYSEISVVPIRGDGEYYVQTLYTVASPSQVKEGYHLIDFEIKKYDITMSDEAYASIAAERKEALNLGILHTDDESFVSAKISAGGENYSTDIRLKGDWTDHLRTDQWSFRVEVQGDFAIWGLQKFSLQPVTTRNGIWEYLIYELYREQGGVAIRYDFADVTVNGVYLGVFAVEEFTEKRVIENSLNREGPIIKVNEAPMWVRTTYYQALTAPWEDFGVSSQKKTVASTNLSKYASYGITLLNKYKAGEESVENVFDVDKFIQLSAVLDIFSAHHGRAEHNMRFYYNPVSALLEPIPFDEIASPGNLDTHLFLDTDSGFADMGELYQRAMHDIMQLPGKEAYATQLLLNLAEELPEYFARQEETITQYETIILRDDPDFYMNLEDIYPKTEQILALDQSQEPVWENFYHEDSGVNVFQMYNPNPVSVYLYDLYLNEEKKDSLYIIPPFSDIWLIVPTLEEIPSYTWETMYNKLENQVLELSFFSVGHAYGNITNVDGTLHPPLVDYIQSLESEQMDFALFTGDIRKNGTGTEYAQLTELMTEIDTPFYAVPGNHDLTSKEQFEDYTQTEQFFQFFDRTFGYELQGEQLLIYLDVYENLDSNGSFIPQEQLDMVAEALELHPQVQNVFLALHQLLFLDFTRENYGGFIPNSLVGYESTGENNFYTELLPLFDEMDCPVYFIAGDTGAFDNGYELYYQEDGRFTYLSNGVGGGTADSILEFYVYSNGYVDLQLVALNQEDPQDLGDIQDYWKGGHST